MKRIKQSLIASLFFSFMILAGCTADGLLADEGTETTLAAQSGTDQEGACWGQATAVFAQFGVMGEHASEQPTPRLGLANLADLLFEAGIISEGTMQALGAFVAAESGLSIDACL